MATQNPTNPDPKPIRNVAVLAFPFGAHASFLHRLTGALSAAIGHAVAFSFFSTARSNRSLPGGGSALECVRHFDVADGLPEGHVPQGSPLGEIEMFIGAAWENFAAAMVAAEAELGERFSCVVSDAFIWFAGDYADERGVPWVPVWTSAQWSLMVHLEADEIRRRRSVAEREGTLSKDQVLDFLPGSFRFSDIPKEVLMMSSDSLFHEMLDKIGLALPKATAVVINSFRQLDPENYDYLQTKLGRLLSFSASPVPSPDPDGCLEWLSHHGEGTVVYVSFGTAVVPPPSEVEALVGALTKIGLPSLWSFRGSPEKKPKLRNGKVVTWAPQTEVLGHSAVGAFVSHCGWNSFLESASAGVPMVCRPFFGDHGINARVVEAVWGVGVGFGDEGLTEESCSEALRKVMLDGEEKRIIRERVSVLKRIACEATSNNCDDFNALVELMINP